MPGTGRARSGSLRVVRLCVIKISTEAVKLALLVVGQADGWVRRIRQVAARRPRGGDRLRPPAGDLLQLRPVNKALPAIRHQIRLRIAPVTQRSSPLRRAADVVEPQALDDDRAVHDARHHRPDLAAGDRHHHLVEPADPLGHLAHRDKRLAVAEHPQRPKIGISGAPADRRGPQREIRGQRGFGVERAEKPRNQHVTRRRAVEARLCEHPLGSRQPSARPGHLTLQEQAQGQQGRAASRRRPIARLERRPVSIFPRVCALVVLADQIRGHRQPLEILRGKGTGPSRRRQRVIRLSPRPAGEGATRRIDHRSHAEFILAHHRGDAPARWFRPGSSRAPRSR